MTNNRLPDGMRIERVIECEFGKHFQGHTARRTFVAVGSGQCNATEVPFAFLSSADIKYPQYFPRNFHCFSARKGKAMVIVVLWMQLCISAEKPIAFTTTAHV